MERVSSPDSLANFSTYISGGCDHTSDLVEGLGYESLDGFETLHHKTQSGKLTAAVGNELIGQRLWEDLLQAEGLESSEGRT